MAFFGLIMFLIFIYWRPQDFIPFLLNLRIIFLIMSYTVLFGVLEKLKSKKSLPLFVFSLDHIVLFFYIIVVISTLNYHWLKYTLDIFVEFGKILIFYLLIANCVDNKFKLNVFLYFLSMLTFLIAGIAILQRYGIDLLNVGMVDGDRIQGVGIYNNPNYLAYSVAMVIPIQYFIFRRYRLLPVRIINFLVMATSYVCILYTKSRGGLICVLGVTAFMFAQRKKVWVKYAVLGCAVGMLFVLPAIMPRFATLSRDQGSIQARIEAWHSGLQMIKQHPLIGVGYGLFNEYHKGKTAHSSFVLAGAETGGIGLFLWLAMIYFSMKLLESKNVAAKYQNHAMTLEASVVGYLLCAFFATFTYRVTFYIICGLVSALLRIDLQEKVLLLDDKENAIKSFIERKRITWFDIRNILVLEAIFIFLWHIIIKNR